MKKIIFVSIITCLLMSCGKAEPGKPKAELGQPEVAKTHSYKYTILATSDKVKTEIVLKEDDIIEITAYGKWTVSSNYPEIGPDGFTGKINKKDLSAHHKNVLQNSKVDLISDGAKWPEGFLKSYSKIPDWSHGCLLMGVEGSDFSRRVGSTYKLTSQTSGRVWFGINDNDPTNNSGEVFISVIVTRK